ncbi:MAG: hypothetical protein KIT07_00185 [Anaerolineales bacterium]|nr:hypothetical protein [Xanthobacteraceae bacterium]MCW5796315.1 hypothetical protein [Nitrospira sp.]MCW5886521.1 hypothetical protein [Anaerolineales bacterium]
MIFARIAEYFIRRAEKRVGVQFDYVHQIAKADLGLLKRYNRLFGFLDPNTKVPEQVYHAARLRGAVSADCGTCVEAEINLARNAGVGSDLIDLCLSGSYADLSKEVSAAAMLADAVTSRREDHPEARATILAAFGEAGLIEIAFAMNGAAMLPGIKRSMGLATACNLDILRRQMNG